jgi:hypothetical protein
MTHFNDFVPCVGANKSKQPLGLKKHRRAEALLGVYVKAVYTNANWPHHWVEAWLDEKNAFFLNTKTGIYCMSVIDGTYITKVVWEWPRVKKQRRTTRQMQGVAQ